jgi:hypothetical protein
LECWNLGGLSSILLLTAGCATREPNVRLFDWERGVGVESLEQPDMAMYLWFYEWNMFEAVQPGEHTNGDYKRFAHELSANRHEMWIRAEDMSLKATAARDGAELELTITNTSGHDWPDVAGIIPCFNPGPIEQRNPHFANTNTYFVGPEGLGKQDAREIHFNSAFRPQIDARSRDGRFAFTHKWPTSPVDATAGVLLRESDDGVWVTGIAWKRFLSAQGHNPWQCMHLCIRVGPLHPGESRTIRGRIYLMKGDRHTLLRRCLRDDLLAPDRS